jgi:VanZ family protein
MTPASLRAIVLAWLPAVLWAALIWVLGTDTFSAPQTSRILGPLLAWLLPDLDPRERLQIAAVLRKLAHPSVYGVLAALAWYGASRTVAQAGLVARAALALAPVLALAVADEWRQSGSAARTGAAFDVLLDTAGGLAVVAIAAAWVRARADRLPRIASRRASRPPPV